MNQSRLNCRVQTSLSCGGDEVTIILCECVCHCIRLCVCLYVWVCGCVCVCIGHMIIHSHETIEESVSYYGVIRRSDHTQTLLPLCVCVCVCVCVC